MYNTRKIENLHECTNIRRLQFDICTVMFDRQIIWILHSNQASL